MYRIILVFFLMMPFILKGQSSGDTSTVQFFVHLDPLTSIDTLNKYLEDLNSEEIWKTSDNTLALWEVSGYPFLTPSGEQITNINSVIRESKKKTKIQDATFNLLTAIEELPDSPTSTFNISDYTIAQGTQNEIKISILDTGIDPNISNSSTGNLNYNLTSYTGYDYVNKDLIPEDDHGHGTHIAGIIHSITHGVSTTGLNIKFDIRKTHNSLGQGYLSDIVIAIFDAVKDKADIINMSFGMPENFDPAEFFPLQFAIREAASKSVLVIAAAGNDSKDIDILTNTTLPAAFPEDNILSIVSLDNANALSTFSNFGLVSADLGTIGELIPGPDLAGGIKYGSGTSQATAIVSGLAGLIATYGTENDMYYLKCAILSGADAVSALSGITSSGGKINLSASKLIYQNLTPNYMVTNATNQGPGSLKYGLTNVCGVQEIIISPSLNGQTISMDIPNLNINTNLRIIGTGENNSLIELLGNTTLKINRSGDLRLSDLSIVKAGSDPTIINEGVLNLSSNVRIE